MRLAKPVLICVEEIAKVLNTHSRASQCRISSRGLKLLYSRSRWKLVIGLKSAKAPAPDPCSYISLVLSAALHTLPSCHTTQSSMGPVAESRQYTDKFGDLVLELQACMPLYTVRA